MDGKFFRLCKFERLNPKTTPGTRFVRLETRILDYSEDFRGVSDAAKLTFLCLCAGAPKHKNVFPNKMDALREILGIEKIELDELLEGEYISVIDEQQYFEGVEPPDVAENRANEMNVDALLSGWNDMARTCGLAERTRVKYRGSIYDRIVSRFKDAEWIERYPQALDALPGLELLTKPGGVGTGKWRANFDWFVNPHSVDMILNGKYGTPVHREGMFVNNENDI